MQGLVLYNGSSKTKKVQQAAFKICDELSKKNIKMNTIRNNEIFNFINIENKSELIFSNMDKPDFVVAWDKDIKLIEMIENSGIKTFNTSKSIACCDDKSLMHKELINSNIKIPKTILAPLVFMEYSFNENYYSRIIDLLGENFILKENYGSFGMQVYKIDSYEKFYEITKKLGNKGFVMQENIKSSCGRDVRFNIVGDEVVGAMLRTNDNDFRANVTLGANVKMFEPNQKFIDTALMAHKKLGLSFSGVDILFGNNDEPILCEVNSNPNFLSFEEASGINFAQKITEYIIGEL